MTQDPAYTIYVCEEWYEKTTGKKDSWYHCFLALVQEKDSSLKPVQELHFESSMGQNMQPVIRSGLRSPEWFDERFLSPLKSGTEEEVLPYWNYGLKGAREYGRRGVRFQNGYRHKENARNCRTASKAVMTLMGLGLTHEFSVAAAGTKATGFPTEPVFYPEGQQKMPLAGLRRINQRLIEELRDPELDIPSHPFAKGM